MRKPVVGETLFLVDPGPDVHGGVPCTVYKVGRKYFHVKEDGWRDLRFYIDSWREDVNYGVAKNLLFESEQAYLNERIRDRQHVFLSRGSRNVNLISGKYWMLTLLLGSVLFMRRRL